MRDCIGAALQRSVISRSTNQMQKLKNQSQLRPSVSRAWNWLRVFTLSSHWLLLIFHFLLIGRCDYFGFGVRTVKKEKRSIAILQKEHLWEIVLQT